MVDQAVIDMYFDEEEYTLAYERAAGDDADPILGDAYDHYLANSMEMDLNPSNLFDESDFLSNALDKFAELWPEDGWGDVTVQMLRDWIVENTPNETALTYYAVDTAAYASLDLEPVAVTGDEIVVEPPELTFAFTQSARTVNEGSSVTYTVTASQAVEADTEFAYELSTTAASADDFSGPTAGTVTIEAGETTATFTIATVKGDGAELAEAFTVTLTDDSDAVVGALNNKIIDTSSNDITAPTVTAGTFNYDENQAADDVLATVVAEDNEGGTGVASFAITEGNDDGYFAINDEGEITLTAAGLTAASNDYETPLNSFDLMVTATDAAGNTSDAAAITLEIDDVDDVAPTYSSSVISGTTATLSFNEALSETSPTPAITDFKVTLKGASGQIAVNSVTVTGSTVQLTLGRAPATGETFQVAYTTGTNPLEDAAGNDVASFSGKDLTVDNTAPVVTAGQTFSYQEGAYDDTNDIVGTVIATDNTSVTNFTIASGNDAGYFAIDSTGKITLTTAGLAATAASNDFETTPNSFTLVIQATDGAGNVSALENVGVNVTNDTTDDPAAGQTFPLTDFDTTGVYDSLTGTTGSDTYSAGPDTAETGDVINDLGGSGDKLTVHEQLGAAATIAPTLTGIEEAWVRNESTGDDLTFSGSNANGLMEVWADRVTDSAGNNNGVIFNNISKDVQLGIFSGATAAGNRADVTFTLNDVTGNADTATLVLDGASADDVTINNVETLNIMTTGNSSRIDGNLVGNAATKLVFTGTGDVTLDDININAANSYKVDASDLSGAIDITLENQAAGKTITYSGGTGGDTVRFAAAGDFTVNDDIDGGTGTNTINILAGADLTASTGNMLKNFQVFDAAGGTGSYDMDFIDGGGTSSTITDAAVSADLAGGATITDLAVGGGVSIGADLTSALTVSQKGAAAAGSNDDSLAFDLTAKADLTVSSLITNDIESVSVESNAVTGKTTGHTITATTFNDATTVSFSGDEKLTVAALGATAATSIDASDMTDKFIMGGATDAATILLLQGGFAADTLILDSANQLANSTVQGNGGADTIDLDNSGGAVAFSYKLAAQSDSTASAFDEVSTFVTTEDTIDISFLEFAAGAQAVVDNSAIVTTTGLGAAATFNISTANAVGFFNNGADRAIAIEDSGADTFVFIDANKDGDWSAADDMVFELIGISGGAVPVVGDFAF